MPRLVDEEYDDDDDGVGGGVSGNDGEGDGGGSGEGGAVAGSCYIGPHCRVSCHVIVSLYLV